MKSTIPTVDIAPWLNPHVSESARQHVVAAMRDDACTTYGFFNLIGHGVAPAQRQEILDCAKLFFTLPEDEKMKVWIGNSVGRSFRGYEPPGIQTHQEGLLPDTKECFIVGHEVPATDPESGTFSTGPNLWPAAEGHRYSVPFFLNGQLGLRCKALDGSGVETVVGEHIRGRLIETMGVTGERLR
ncbi:Clavaminate synthase-like protein [Aspergillus fijiensis CBS 313.89]|uniref:Clavaminate synthase-like protein n=1 Tax=Aspergillus fijiensis CBS 313.89 TaxID=1448319 RepID=A0A8G1RDI9_9EURO|nr:Clavaminate synthase-like protein [Aspergillus fijiensis CBS 313.89]RAK70798.1 Clavaminate synthase-like protein [Aspergillus fijiensis CBS 313.89]